MSINDVSFKFLLFWIILFHAIGAWQREHTLNTLTDLISVPPLTYDERFGNIYIVDDRDTDIDCLEIWIDYNQVGYMCGDSTGYVYSFEPM